MARELHLERVHFAVRRPGLFRRWSGLISLISLLAAAPMLGTNSARMYPGTYFTPHRAADFGGGLLFLAFAAAAVYFITLLAQELPAQVRLAGAVTIRDGALEISGGLTERIALADVEAGWEDGLGRAVLRLRDGREITANVGEQRTAAELLEAAGVTPAQRVARIPIGSALSSVWGGRALGCAGLAVAVPAVFFSATGLGGALLSVARGLAPASEILSTAAACAPAAIMLLALLTLLAPRKAVVGTDGVAVEGLLRRRFLPYAEITEVRGDARGVRLGRRKRRGLLLPRAPGGEALESRIRAAMETQGQGALEARLEALDRGGRPVSEWLDGLRRLADRSAGYRAAAIQPEQLAAVVEDASVPRERRIAAAVSAAATGDEEARRRVRVAAQACADEELRAALEEAAEAELAEAALERAARI